MTGPICKASTGRVAASVPGADAPVEHTPVAGRQPLGGSGTTQRGRRDIGASDVVQRSESGRNGQDDECMTSTWKIELIPVPVTDVDRAKSFYQQIGFNADHDHEVHDGLRFVQLTPPGSACSIVIGTGMTAKAPGSQEIQVVVADAHAARQQLLDAGVEASDVDVQPWGNFVYFRDPDGNSWSLQAIESRPNG